MYQLPIYAFLVAVFLGISLLFLDINTGDSLFEKIPLYYAVLILSFYACSGVGDMLSVFFQDVEVSNQMFPVTIIPLLMTAGWIAVVRHMAPHLIAFSYVSPMRFGYQGLILIQYDDSLIEKYLSACKLRPAGCFSNDCII